MGKVTIKDFQKLDIRIGTVVKAEVPEWSHWVIRLTVDFGKELGKRKIFAGILGFYKPKDLEGKQMPFIVNLEPKKIGPKGEFSEGMMMAVSVKHDKPIKVGSDPTSREASQGAETDEEPVLLTISKKVPNGSRVR